MSTSSSAVVATTTTCHGCGSEAVECFQCPLCQAEQQSECGFYCSQSCFARNWLTHRAERHKSGVARERGSHAAGTDTAKTAKPKLKKTRTGTTAVAKQEATDGDAERRPDKKPTDSKAASSSTTTAPRTAETAIDAAVRRADDTEAAAVSAALPHYLPWPVIPSRAARLACGVAQITPPLQPHTPRAIIALGENADSNPNSVGNNNDTDANNTDHANNNRDKELCLSRAMWPCIIAAVDYVAACLPESALRVLVVAPEPSAAGAFAWAARCARLSSCVQLLVCDDDDDNNNNNKDDNREERAEESETESAVWSRTRILVTSQALLSTDATRDRLLAWLSSEEGKAVSAARDQKCTTTTTTVTATCATTPSKQSHADEGVLITLPGVRCAESLQRVHTRALFFVAAPAPRRSPDRSVDRTNRDGAALRNGPSGAKSGTNDMRDATLDEALVWYTTDEITHRVSDMSNAPPTHHATSWHWSAAPLRVPNAHTSPRIDDGLLNAGAVGGDGAMHRRIAQMHRLGGQAMVGLEERVHNTLLCCWGALHVAHAHHRLAHLMRYCVGHNDHVRHAAGQSGAVGPSRVMGWHSNGVAKEEAASSRSSAAHRSGLSRGLHSALRSSSSSSSRSNTNSNNNSYHHHSMIAIALRAVLPLCRYLPPLRCADTEAASVRTPRSRATRHAEGSQDDDASSEEEEEEQKQHSVSAVERGRYANYYSHTPNLQLQAILCYLQPVLTPRLTDDLAALWAIPRLLPSARHPALPPGRATRKRQRGSEPRTSDEVEDTNRVSGRGGGDGNHRNGPSLVVHHCARAAVIHRLRIQYAARVGGAMTDFLVILMHLCYDAVAVYSRSVANLAARLLWSVTLETDVGALSEFLAHCQLLHPVDRAAIHRDCATSDAMIIGGDNNPARTAAANTSGDSIAHRNTPCTACARHGEDVATGAMMSTTDEFVAPSSLSSRIVIAPTQRRAAARQEAKRRAAALLAHQRRHAVRAPTVKQYIPLPWIALPLSHARARQVAQLRTQACEEILMAMPRQPRPMYVSDVGNLIGRWSAFNARYDGALGVSLVEFAQSMPESFRVVGKLITRRRAGINKAIRIRYDNDGEDDTSGRNNTNRWHRNDDVDEEDREDDARGSGRRSSSDRTASPSGLSARARKKRACKEFNKSRFNRNYKSMDASARVPGYVKHAPRRVKGRGRKVNKRVVKRGN